MSTIDNNIISSIGAGSGIDTKALVKQLTEIEGAAKQNRIDSSREQTEAQISDFGLLKSALYTFQSSLKALADPEGLFSKTAAFTDTDTIVPEKLGTDVETGTYSLRVLDTAQAQSVSSAMSFAELTDTVGQGELTFRLGSWDEAAGSFTANAGEDSHTIVIDESNNTLTGLRDAINKADFGVQASIVNDGTGYKLLMTAPSGASNELEVQVAEAEGSVGLSRFAFSEGNQQLNATQEGKDAQIEINGLLVTRSTNEIDDVVEGFSFSLVKPDPDQTVTVTITDDKAYAEQKIREFVAAYNQFLEDVKPAFETGLKKKETEEGEEEVPEKGSLATDSLAKSVISQMRTMISNAVPGLPGEGFTALTHLGIRTERDGTLSIEEKYLRSAIDEHYDLVQELFTAGSSSSTSGITISSSHASTVSGSFDVVITQPPEKGQLATSASGVSLDTTGKDYSFDITVDGVTASTISLPSDKTYSSKGAMAEDLQSLINADSALKGVRASVVVAYDAGSDAFTFTSNQYGSASTVAFANASADFNADFGIDAAVATAGKDVQGTVDGVEALGIGNGLLPPGGSRAYGLTFSVTGEATSGTVNYTRGFAGEMSGMIDRFQKSDGIIGARTATLEDRLETLDTDQKRHDSRMSAFHDRMLQQFIAMENILNGLNSSGGYLENLIDTLPFTAKK